MVKKGNVTTCMSLLKGWENIMQFLTEMFLPADLVKNNEQTVIQAILGDIVAVREMKPIKEILLFLCGSMIY